MPLSVIDSGPIHRLLLRVVQSMTHCGRHGTRKKLDGGIKKWPSMSEIRRFCNCSYFLMAPSNTFIASQASYTHQTRQTLPSIPSPRGNTYRSTVFLSVFCNVCNCGNFAVRFIAKLVQSLNTENFTLAIIKSSHLLDKLFHG